MPRFSVEKRGSVAYFIKDNMASEWKMPEQAVSLYLRKEAAEKIASILNSEWSAFLANPE